jgi:hypothetical protein
VERVGQPGGGIAADTLKPERNVWRAQRASERGKHTGIVIYNVTSQNTCGNYKRQPHILALTPLGHFGGGGEEMHNLKKVVVHDVFGVDAGEEKGLGGTCGRVQGASKLHPRRFCRSVHIDKIHAVHAPT